MLAKQRLHTWDKVAEWLGDSHKKGSCHRLGTDIKFRPSVILIKMVEERELPPLKIEVAACPSCLQHGKIEVHGAGLDCGGRPIASVVTLAPDEAVVKRNGSAPQRARVTVGIGGLKPETRAKLNERRKAHGWTWDEYLDIIASLEDAYE